jgi:hypothetical protein
MKVAFKIADHPWNYGIPLIPDRNIDAVYGNIIETIEDRYGCNQAVNNPKKILPFTGGGDHIRIIYSLQ